MTFRFGPQRGPVFGVRGKEAQCVSRCCSVCGIVLCAGLLFAFVLVTFAPRWTIELCRVASRSVWH